jgi:hypothetical protein
MSPDLGMSGPDSSPPSSDHATAALAEPVLGRLVHQRHHRPPLLHEPRGGGGVEPGRGLVQHQQAQVESSPDTRRRWSRGDLTGTRGASGPCWLLLLARGGVPCQPCHLHVTTHDVSDRQAKRQAKDQSWMTFL